MKSALLVLPLALVPAAELMAADPAYALRQSHVVPAAVVLARPDKHPEREIDAIAGQPSFGGFFSLGVPGVDRLRFEARGPQIAGVAAGEFEYRISPEARR